MTDIVINTCFGGFGLSDKAYERLIELGMTAAPYDDAGNVPDNIDIHIASNTRYSSITGNYYKHFDEPERSDARLVQVVRELEDEANGQCAKLKIVEIPDGVDWEISEYDGKEHVAEKHSVWY